ncbi:Protein Y92H12A.5, partial [Aphelenchoides avenae]
ASLINRIGRYFWLQLTECTHCGAFETASNSFEKLCRKLWALSGEEDAEGDEPLVTPDMWLQQIIEALKGGKGFSRAN